jgi:hypothetical protein
MLVEQILFVVVIALAMMELCSGEPMEAAGGASSLSAHARKRVPTCAPIQMTASLDVWVSDIAAKKMEPNCLFSKPRRAVLRRNHGQCSSGGTLLIESKPHR